MKYTEKVKKTLTALLNSFEDGNIIEAVSKTVIKRRLNIPCNHWSFRNQIITALVGDTTDARGYKQWEAMGRKVKKGESAFYILAPLCKNKEDKDPETGAFILDENNKPQMSKRIVGFNGVPVFAYEQTEGAELPEDQNPKSLGPQENPPLYDIAETFGLAVKYVTFDGEYFGYYQDKKNLIALCTHDQAVFFHELAHAAHYRALGNDIKNRTKGQKEVVAELCAAVIARIYGNSWDSHSYKYIKAFAEEEKKDPLTACYSVLSDVESVLQLIFSKKEELETVTA